MPSQHLRTRAQYGLGSRSAGDELMDLISGVYAFSTHWYVDAENGNDTVHNGLSADKAFATMNKAFTSIADNAVIHLRGPITETLTCPDGITGVTVMGDGAGLRHGSTSNTAEGYAASWQDDAAAPLVQVHSQGWTFKDILFAPNSADSAIEILSDGSADPEHTASGLRILGCRFAGGAYGIEDNGGSGYVTVAGCHFDTCTTAAIANVSTSNALPLQWRIYGNDFMFNATHIDAAFSKSIIRDNVFGNVSGSALYIDLTSGSNNIVTRNTFGGLYDTTDYIAGTSDVWYGNYADDTEATSDGTTLDVPAA